MHNETLCRTLDSQNSIELTAFFLTIDADDTARHFRPHPFTPAEANRIANYAGRDLYVGLWSGGNLAGYGLLRGWDAGFAVPSLGIYLAPKMRGTGASDVLMAALHAAAAAEGATRVRLRVLPDNMRARRLYDRCGYTFDGTIERGELVGYFDLPLRLGETIEAHPPARNVA